MLITTTLCAVYSIVVSDWTKLITLLENVLICTSLVGSYPSLLLSMYHNTCVCVTANTIFPEKLKAC